LHHLGAIEQPDFRPWARKKNPNLDANRFRQTCLDLVARM
jgi:hypothetical protein